MPVEKQFKIGEDGVVEVLLSSNTSNGVFSVLLERCPPNEGPPPHVHQHEDEFFLPIEGQFEFFDGSTWSPLSASGAFGPRGHLHTWRNVGSTDGKILVVASGGAFDKFIEQFARLRLPEQMSQLNELSAKYGISYKDSLPDII
jgi:uncharacterized cupin superfamily protein